MQGKISQLIIGNLEDKKQYNAMMKRVKALPHEYSTAYRKIQNYIYNVGLLQSSIEAYSDMSIFQNLLELFEECSMQGKRVCEVTGNNVAKFCDELIAAMPAKGETEREKFNREFKEQQLKEQNNDR